MTNVVHLNLPRRQGLADRQRALVANFSHHRRGVGDVFWLKENAELLNILETGRPAMPDDLLEGYESVYDGLSERMRFFPQYYRFLLGICLDLEDLGLPGKNGAALCDWAATMGLAEAELSDLQRAEARRLLSRRIDIAPDMALDARLRHFIERSQTFALPNKKAAYELTHIVFYLSEYGRRDPQLGTAAIVSLEYAGLLAYLDQNADLLAEVCAALRFAGQTPSAIWEDWLLRGLEGFVVADDPSTGLGDDYHDYLVTSWWAMQAGHDPFPGQMPEARATFHRANVAPGPLRSISEYLYHLGPARSADWVRMRDVITDVVGPEQHHVLSSAEQSTERFDAFFEGFARA